MIANALLGLPPVVVGFIVYLLLSRSDPLGSLGNRHERYKSVIRPRPPQSLANSERVTVNLTRFDAADWRTPLPLVGPLWGGVGGGGNS